MTDRNALAGAPVMPEEYDRIVPSEVFMPHARAFGAGLVDPMGLPSWAANALSGTPGSDWYKRRMQELRDESPIAAGAGSAVIPVALGLGAGVGAGALTAAEALQMPPWAFGAGIGATIGRARAAFMPPPPLPDDSSLTVRGIPGQQQFVPPRRQRPQSAYPPGGAY